MPKKGHRAASRQAQLNRKKKRGRGGRGQQFDTGPIESEATVATAVDVTSEEEKANQETSEESATSQPQATTQTAPAPQPTRRPQQAQRASNRRATSQAAARRARQRTAAPEPVSINYKYLGTELKQIAIWTSLIVAILIGLTFALRA